ncbi:nuclear transport factor 2 family protein [Pseudooctadecabacter sp.]|uniref:nuclear transport factor 2 family protein n=1 Tax=Pseudooctadecabacter sp. TaxID=1966338 RepID=UPI0035C87CB2
MTTAKQNAISLYLDGIQNGNPRAAVAAYTGDRYTQHSTGVSDGADGFIAFFEPFINRNPVRDFQVVRTLQEGRHVFVQVYQNLNHGQAEWLTTDFFASDENGKIIEHWDVIAPIKPVNPSGRSQFDGPTEVTDLDKTAQNKALVVDFINVCLIGRDMDRFRDFISSDSYVEHNADRGDGIESAYAFFAADDTPLTYQECFLAVAEGNFVATLNRASWAGQDLCQVDVFRVEDGLIVEHWDNSEDVPPKSEWANSGKF